MSDIKILGDTQCPECASRGGDNTHNHLLIFENSKGENFAKCTRSSCGYYISPKDFDPSKVKAKPREVKDHDQALSELEEVNECEIEALTSRKIKQVVAQRYGVRVGYDTLRAERVVQHFYPKTVDDEIKAYKVRNLDPKFFYHVGYNVNDCDLFGIEQAKRSDVGDKFLWITEDELSAMSAYQVLDENSKTSNKPAVVALPDGTDSAKHAISKELDWINTFNTVVLVMDSDTAGSKAVETILKMVPHAKVVALPPLKLKREGVDPNDYLMDGKSKELFNMLLFRQEAPRIEGLISIKDCLEEALTKPEYGLDYPWPTLSQLTFGQRTGEIIAVGGGVGIGKTLLAHEIAAWNWANHGEASFMIMLEENNGDTVKNVAGKIDSVPYHRPDREFNVEQLTETALGLEGGIHLWRSNINQNIRFDFDKIAAGIRYHAVVNNIKHVFFDNITAATQHLTPTEINTEVGRIALTLAGLADELGLQIFIFSHLNSPGSGASHEEGGQVREYQFTGSRALMRWCQVIIGFERNKQADGQGKHDSRIRLLKHRKFGTTGYLESRYVPDTGRLIEEPHDTMIEKEEY